MDVPRRTGGTAFFADRLTLAAAGARGNQLVRWRVPTGEPSAVPAGAGSGPGGGVAVASAGRLAAREISRDGRDQMSAGKANRLVRRDRRLEDGSDDGANHRWSRSNSARSEARSKGRLTMASSPSSVRGQAFSGRSQYNSTPF